MQVLQRILMGTDVVKNVNKNNASHAVLFEALALVFLYFLYLGSQMRTLSPSKRCFDGDIESHCLVLQT